MIRCFFYRWRSISFKFYKCDWGVPMLFECPEELHFNPVHQVCDWPWQAGCDSSWIGCPRPIPRCPTRYPDLLPHPFLCDRFYQCDWGTPRLQACPAGLHFDSRLKVCDWSYNSNCRNCWGREGRRTSGLQIDKRVNFKKKGSFRRIWTHLSKNGDGKRDVLFYTI